MARRLPNERDRDRRRRPPCPERRPDRLGAAVWYPRLAPGTPTERAHWRVIGRGEGIHWRDGENVSVVGILAGQPTGESQAWLKR